MSRPSLSRLPSAAWIACLLLLCLAFAPSGLGDEVPVEVSAVEVRTVVAVSDTEKVAVSEGTLFTVHPPANLVIETPGGLPSDDAPFDLRIIGYGPYCPQVLSSGVTEPGFLDVTLDLHCVIGTPPVTLFNLDAEVGPLPAGDYVVRVFAIHPGLGSEPAVSREEITVYRADGCLPSATELCLNDDRFRLEITWRDFEGNTDSGFAIPLEDRDDTGMFWFFNEDNVELTVKVLDGCGVNGHYWVFVSPGSTVQWDLTVTDTLRVESSTYSNSLGDVPSLLPDTAAFATCP